ncbi:hypothetical protein N9C22_03760 [Paracoccaceae bacterium]|nr:hypothetical protein [Paracoccaceae bacterium]
MEERVIRKGAVAAYASSGKRYGDDAVKRYQNAKRILTSNIESKSTEEKVDIILAALVQISDGLISNRRQIGSVSAQITATTML